MTRPRVLFSASIAFAMVMAFTTAGMLVAYVHWNRTMGYTDATVQSVTARIQQGKTLVYVSDVGVEYVVDGLTRHSRLQLITTDVSEQREWAKTWVVGSHQRVEYKLSTPEQVSAPTPGRYKPLATTLMALLIGCAGMVVGRRKKI